MIGTLEFIFLPDSVLYKSVDMALEVGINFSPCDGLSLVSTTRLHPTLAEAFGNGNALKEVSQADGARDLAKLKIHMFLTWPYPEM